MLIDFSEIPDDHAFENFCMELLQNMGLKISVAPAIGPDSGRDIICEEPSRFGQRGLRWLVSCKHFALSRKSVGVNDDAAKSHKLDEHDCNGFMFFYSTAYTEGLRLSVERVCSTINRQYKFFNAFEIERILLSGPQFYPLIRRYFPLSHGRLTKLLNADPCCDQMTPQDALYAVYIQTDVSGSVGYYTVCNSCLENFSEQLDTNGTKYGVTQIRRSSW